MDAHIIHGMAAYSDKNFFFYIFLYTQDEKTREDRIGDAGEASVWCNIAVTKRQVSVPKESAPLQTEAKKKSIHFRK